MIGDYKLEFQGALMGKLGPEIKVAKRRFSEFSGEASCNQEYASGIQQRLNNEAEPVIA